MLFRPTAALLLPLLLSSGALAGDPYRSSDPNVTPPGKIEVTLAGDYTYSDGQAEGSLLDFKVEIGVRPDLDIRFSADLAFDRAEGSSTRFGLGDVELGFRYRFLDQSERSWLPAAAIYPRLRLPTGDEDRGLGSGHVQLFLPLWLQREAGPWTVFGGGGYWINPGAGNKNWWFSGLAVTRKLGESWEIGAELFHATADEEGGKSQTGVTLGASYELAENHEILASIGRGLRNADETNRFSAYLGYKATF